MKIGVVDIGNSLIKCAIIENESILSFEKFDFDSIEKMKNFFEGINEIAYCSVVEGINLGKVLKDKELYELNYQNSLIELNYTETLGSDRIAKAHYIALKIKEISIILDFGTATVIDVVDSKFLGGLILIGYKTYLKCLSQSTSKLPNLEYIEEFKVNKLIGNSTQEAIILGLVNSYKFLVSKIESEFNVKHKFITGGNAKFFLKHFNDYIYDPYISLKGLFLWFNNFKTH
ncbi:MAG: type III pantothenate kinase [candidate division WOR-3 bacterium]